MYWQKGGGGGGNQPVSTTNPLPVNASVTATVSGFAPNGSAAALAVTSTTGNVALPSGTAVLVTNTGANAAYVQLGTGNTVTATTSAIPVQANNGAQCFTVGSNTFLAAITATSTTSLNIQGGAGLCNGIPGSASGGGTQNVNVAQVAGNNTLTGAGATGTGSQRVTQAQDTSTIAGAAPGTAGAASANVVSVQGVASMTPVQVTTGNAVGVTSTNLSSTISTTNTFQSIQALTSGRKGCSVQNNGIHTMWVFFGAIGSATENASFTLGSGQALYCAVGGLAVATDQVSITGTAGDVFAASFQ